MTDTEGVKEVRRWRRQVYEETRELTPAQLRSRDEEILRRARQAGIEFRAILAAPRSSATE